jgi:hypothetical protein
VEYFCHSGSTDMEKAGALELGFVVEEDDDVPLEHNLPQWLPIPVTLVLHELKETHLDTPDTLDTKIQETKQIERLVA